MPERKASAYISDILNSIDHIHQYTITLSFEDFASNYMILEACLYNIQLIGEAVSKIPDDIKESNPLIPWSLIKGMRNRLIHEYFGTDIQVVWNVIKNELPSFKSELVKIHTLVVSQNR